MYTGFIMLAKTLLKPSTLETSIQNKFVISNLRNNAVIKRDQN